METKKWYASKTLWVNALAIAGAFLSSHFGITLTAEESAGVLAVVNIVLRIVTKHPLS